MTHRLHKAKVYCAKPYTGTSGTVCRTCWGERRVGSDCKSNSKFLTLLPVKFLWVTPSKEIKTVPQIKSRTKIWDRKGDSGQYNFSYSKCSGICLPQFYRALNGSEMSCWCPYLTVQLAKFPKISLFLNLHNSSIVHHAKAALCKSLDIQASCITK